MFTAMKNAIFLTISVLLFVSCATKRAEIVDLDSKKALEEQNSKVKNIILLIGDGMGLSQMSSAYYFGKSEPNFSRFPVVGFSRTSSSSDKITDSAAGATALSAGQKTYNGAIAVDTDTNAVETLVEHYAKAGKKTGLISTSSITHATPAAFYAHVASRNAEHEIARAMKNAPVDFFAGGGKTYFRASGQNPTLLQEMENAGWNIDTTELGTDLKEGEKFGFLLGLNGMLTMTEGRSNFSKKATELAIGHLQNENGFFLMVEGSQIDWGGHANDAQYVIQETLDFDQTVGAALDFAEQDGETLVIVTADHETGGFTLAGREKSLFGGATRADYDDISPTFSTGGHSAALVPVLAFGPGAEKFSGIYQNTAIWAKILETVP